MSRHGVHRRGSKIFDAPQGKHSRGLVDARWLEERAGSTTFQTERSEALIPIWLMLTIAMAAVIAIFLTTDRGRFLAGRLGVPTRWVAPGVPSEDRQFLLRACGGDIRELARRIEAERQQFPELDEARLYRRAIRKEMASPSRKEDS